MDADRGIPRIGRNRTKGANRINDKDLCFLEKKRKIGKWALAASAAFFSMERLLIFPVLAIIHRIEEERIDDKAGTARETSSILQQKLLKEGHDCHP